MHSHYQPKVAPEIWAPFVENSQYLIDGLRSRGIRTIHIGFDPAILTKTDKMDDLFGTYSDLKKRFPDSKALQFALPVADDDLVAIKHDFSAATNNGLRTYLRVAAIRYPILCGACEAANFNPELQRFACVTQTARDLAKLYRPCLAAEATLGPARLSLDDRRRIHDTGADIGIREIDGILRNLSAGRSPSFRGMSCG